jgi:hypothetical protein
MSAMPRVRPARVRLVHRMMGLKVRTHRPRAEGLQKKSI